jgi:predicted RecB family nuclease
MEKSISELVIPQFQGKPKFHYVVKRDCRLVYRCTSVMEDQDDVLNTLIDMFKADKGVVHIFRNGERVKVINQLKIGWKPKYHLSNPS